VALNAIKGAASNRDRSSIPTNDPGDHVRNSGHCVRIAFALQGQRHIRWRSRLSVGATCQGISGSNRIDREPRRFNDKWYGRQFFVLYLAEGPTAHAPLLPHWFQI